MSVAHDAVSESHTGTTGVASVASFTWNHVPVGTPRSALVFVLSIGALTDTSVTYGGTTMTAVAYTAAVTSAEPGAVRAYFLDGVASGTQAVVVNRTNNTVVMYAVCMTQTAAGGTQVYTAGVKTKAGATAEATAASSTSASVSASWSTMALDDGSPGTNSVRYMGVYSGAASVSTASTNTTTLSTAGAIDFGNYVFCSYRDTTPAQGSVTLTITTAIADDLAVVGLAVREIRTAAAAQTAVAATATSQLPDKTAASTAGIGSATAAALSPAAAAGVAASGAAATGTASAPAASAWTETVLATATAVVNDSAPPQMTDAPAASASATAAATDAVVETGKAPDAGLGPGTGIGLTPALFSSLPAVLGAGTGAAFAPGSGVSVNVAAVVGG
jgi:hypothetical protein